MALGLIKEGPWAHGLVAPWALGFEYEGPGHKAHGPIEYWLETQKPMGPRA